MTSHTSPLSASVDPLGGSTRAYYTHASPDLLAKVAACTVWTDARSRHGGFAFSKRLLGVPGLRTRLRYLDGAEREGLNFSSQDYLALASHLTLIAAAHEAMLNVVEYPAVSRNSARFRLQAMASHTLADCAAAAAILTDAVRQARERCAWRIAV